MLMLLDGTSRLLVLRLLIIVSRFPLKTTLRLMCFSVSKTLAPFIFSNFIMEIWKQLHSQLLSLCVTGLIDVLFEISLTGTLCAFLLSYELKVNICTAVCAQKSMPLVKHPLPSPRCPHRSWRHRLYHIVNYAFRCCPCAPFTTILPLLFLGGCSV